MSHIHGYRTYPKDTPRKDITAIYSNEWLDEYKRMPKISFRTDTVYPSLAEAKEAADKMAWDSVVAVLYMAEGEPTSKARETQKRLDRLVGERAAFIDSHHVWDRKSSSVSCIGCGSRLNIDRLHDQGWDKCPLCGTDLRSRTVLSRIERFDALVLFVKGQAGERASGRVMWLVVEDVAC